MRLQRLIVGPVQTNCYILENEEEHTAVVFDPGDRGDKIFQNVVEHDLHLVAVMLTHGHFDHIGGAKELKDLSGAKLGCLKEEEALCKDPYLNLSNNYGMNLSVTPDILYTDGEVIEAAGIECKVLKTPGHTSGGCCYYFEDGNILISGDTLFEESVGRTDFPTSSTSELIRSVKERLFILPEETIVYPGHGGVTTIGHEKLYNPFIV